MIIYLLEVIIFIILLRFLVNLLNHFRSKYFLGLFRQHIENPSQQFTQGQEEVAVLLKDAGIKDAAQTVIWENGLIRSEDAVSDIIRMFEHVIDVYRKRTLDAINPIYWVKFVLNFPREILNLFEFSADALIVKIMLFIWWIFVLVLIFLIVFYPTELRQGLRFLMYGMIRFLRSW